MRLIETQTAAVRTWQRTEMPERSQKITVQAEREALIRMWHEGRISDNVMRQLEAELDLTEARQKVYLMS